MTAVHIPKLRIRADGGQPRCGRPGCGRFIGRVRRDGDRSYFAVNPHVWTRGGDGWWRLTGKRPNLREIGPGSLMEETVTLPALFICGCGAKQVADPAVFGIAPPYGESTLMRDV